MSSDRSRTVLPSRKSSAIYSRTRSLGGRFVRSLRCLLPDGARIKRHLAGPHGPNNSPEFVGDRDRRFVVTSSRLHRERPLMKPCHGLVGDRAAMCGMQHGASAVRE